MVRSYTTILSIIALLCVTLSASAQKKVSNAQIAAQIAQMQQEIESLKMQVAETNEAMAAQKIETEKRYAPHIYGAVLAAYNVSTYNGYSQFNVLNARFGFKGKVSKQLGYVVQVDFNGQGKFSALDAYAIYKSGKFQFSIGQQQIHLTKDLDRGPNSNLFPTPSYPAVYSTKYIGGNTTGVSSFGSRDIGANITYTFATRLPIALSQGVFNGNGANNPTWDETLNSVTRVSVGGSKGFYAGASLYAGSTPFGDNVNIWSGEVSYATDGLFVESVYQQREISYDGDQPLRTGLVQGYYRFYTPKSEVFRYVSPALRWDWGNNVEYANKLNNGVQQEPIDIQRATIAMVFGLTESKVRSRLTIGYEWIFADEQTDMNCNKLKQNQLLHSKFSIAIAAAF